MDHLRSQLHKIQNLCVSRTSRGRPSAPLAVVVDPSPMLFVSRSEGKNISEVVSRPSGKPVDFLITSSSLKERFHSSAYFMGSALADLPSDEGSAWAI